MTNHSSSLTWLSDEELLARVKHLVRREREVAAVVIAHLAEVDERRLYLPEGSSSMFTYGTEVLCFSESAAQVRIQAALTRRQVEELVARLRPQSPSPPQSGNYPR